MILPIQNFIGNSKGETFVWDNFQSLLPSDYVSFHNYYLGLKQVDVILLVPKMGILVIEIKGILAKNIFDVPDASIIRMKNCPAILSPFEQAVKYRNILMNEYLDKNGIDDIYTIQSVCYPFISEDEFVSTHLDKISKRELTFLSEDFQNSEQIIKRIEQIFEIAYRQILVKQLQQYGFTHQKMKIVGNLISPNYDSQENKDTKVMVEKPVTKGPESHYSILVCCHKLPESEINNLVNEWQSGTRIYLLCSLSEVIDQTRVRIMKRIDEMNLSNNPSFLVSSEGVLNFQLCNLSGDHKDFTIIDGINREIYSHELLSFHNNTIFNKFQYDIEHAPSQNIIVKAGAGTGKTYSIIARINYLVWKHKYDPYQLKDAVAMITFTNESADTMKFKLIENFSNRFLITNDPIMLEYIEIVEDMRISTIHSMAKVVLSEYAVLLGLGKDFDIVTGKYKRENILSTNLSKSLKEGLEIKPLRKVSNYMLLKYLYKFLEQLDNKNISIDKYSKTGFGVPIKGNFDALIPVLIDSEKEFTDYCIKNNSISLGSLIRKLNDVVSLINENKDVHKAKIDYLFVDEFQDTDDEQIKILKDFQSIFGYKLFVVGDIKQCIYRFRGAQEKAFDKLKDSATDEYLQITLNKNYRTEENLMSKFNEVFSKWDVMQYIDYKKEDALISKKKTTTKSEFNKIIISDNTDFEKKLVQLVKDKLTTLEANGKIALIVRYNYQVDQIKEIFSKNNLYVETTVGGELFKIDPTIDLYKLVAALKNYDSKKHLYNLYSTSYVADDLSKADLFVTNVDKKDYFYSNLPEQLLKFPDYLNRLKKEPVLKVLRDIIDQVKPWSVFSNQLVSNNNIALSNHDYAIEMQKSAESYYIRNLDLLFEKMATSSNSDYLTLNRISDYLEIMILTRRDEQSRESFDVEKSSAKIICTTVHKAKGLEFDTVILPFCDFNLSNTMGKGEVDMFYVNNQIGYNIKLKNNNRNDYNSNENQDYTLFQNDVYQNKKLDENIDRRGEETRILYVAITRSIRSFSYFTENHFTKRKPTWASLISGGEE